MNMYEYIMNNYENGEPIFLSELTEIFGTNTRQTIKRLVDSGKLERFEAGAYFIPYTTILGTKGTVSTEAYIRKKYLRKDGKTNGYLTGLRIANKNGFTSQNAAVYEICTNEATTKQRKISVDRIQMIIYKPCVPITDKNKNVLQFLDLLTNIDIYSELSSRELTTKLQRYLIEKKIDADLIKEYIGYYPNKVFRNAYYGGIMNELV